MKAKIGQGWQRPASAFVALAAAVHVVLRVTYALGGRPAMETRWGDLGWLDGYARYDSGWYFHIAELGYFYGGPSIQSAVAFFPAYPVSARLLAFVVGNAIVAGILLTLACGLGAAVLFHRWATGALGRRAADLGLALLLVYPFAFYLAGAVYSDALFLVAALAAFTLLERRQPVLAGLAGIVATAARPVGIALVIALVLRQLEIRGVLGGGRPAFLGVGGGDDPPVRARSSWFPTGLHLGRLRPADAGVLLAPLGVAIFCAYLWHRFGEPLAFVEVADAPGWRRTFDRRTVLKIPLIERSRAFGLEKFTFWLWMQGAFTGLSLLSVPVIVRRLGWGYAAYVAVAVGVTAVTAIEFIGMGRYVLVAFPVFAVYGGLLAGAHERWRPFRFATIAILGLSAAGLVWMTGLYASNVFLS